MLAIVVVRGDLFYTIQIVYVVLYTQVPPLAITAADQGQTGPQAGPAALIRSWAVGQLALVTGDAGEAERACNAVTAASSDLEMPWGGTEMGQRRQRALGQVVRVLAVDLTNGIAQIALKSGDATWMSVAVLKPAR